MSTDRLAIIGIIQARFSSCRLPGKVLIPIHGHPLLGYQIARLRRSSELDAFVVATSSDLSDDPIVEFCEATCVPYVRGPLDDVVGRFQVALETFPCAFFARVCGDSPLYDSSLLDEACRLIRASDLDMVSNVSPRSFPKGVSVEILRTDFFQRHAGDIESAQDREHLTPYFYRTVQPSRLLNIRCDRGDFSNVNLCVDTPSDLAQFERIAEALGSRVTTAPWNEAVAALNASEAIR